MTRTVNLAELRAIARRRLPRMIFDFVDGAAEDEFTLRANRDAFARVTFRPRVLIDVSTRSTATEVLGTPLAVPILLAPTGLSRMSHPRGELDVAVGAGRAGVAYTLSAGSSRSIEEVAAEATGPLWFQLYVWKDRALTQRLVERARDAGYRALVLTVDVPVVGRRERDLRSGMTIPPRITRRNLETVLHPRWIVDFLRTRPPITFANLVGEVTDVPPTVGAYAAYSNQQFDSGVTWADLDWLRSIWPGPLLIKGVMSATDAARAAECGLEGIVVSNHGGRQLDGVPGSLDVLPEVVEAVGGRATVLVDGGIRRGTDVVKALCLGASAVLVGRPYLYGLAAGGADGVAHAVALLQGEVDRAMALLGARSIAELDASLVRRS